MCTGVRPIRPRGQEARTEESRVAVPITPVRVGDIVRLKKPHPCGANEWEVNRTGMDIGLTCLGCGRKVRLVRYEFDRRFKGFVRRPNEE
jgi:hypothetical protein